MVQNQQLMIYSSYLANYDFSSYREMEDTFISRSTDFFLLSVNGAPFHLPPQMGVFFCVIWIL